ncbi:unnamed protein product [Moneuplotes crassus]|uniref:HP domain-containing protein n=1 Tax=Euplotes crassus TaxID=5936 RepID=A0AAD1Y828_EUPCR|nr:unnamed protein product [Moneuplotes crassus]
MEELIEKAQEFFNQIAQKPLEVYRIEQFEPKHVPEETYGQFYNGDSYVIVKHNEKENDYDIHYWHGENATMDEEASAAALSVQISDHLTGASRHHLELQGEESQLFMSYFKDSAVTYLQGGVESGFKQTKFREHVPRLLQVKGKKYPRVWTFEPDASILNEGDVFILDHESKLFFWPGTESNVSERMRSISVIQHIKTFDYLSKAKIYYPRDDQEAEAEFWEALGGKPDSIKPAVTDDLEDTQNKELFHHRLFRVCETSDSLVVEEVEERPLKRSHLESDNVFILELEKAIYVWCGKEASQEEKNKAFKTARSFIKDNNKPKGTSVVKVPERSEDSVFKSFFSDFYCFQAINFESEVSATDQMEELYLNKQMSNVEVNIGVASFIKTYIVEDEKLVELDEEENGIFYENNVYVIDVKDSSERRYLYLWVGTKKTLHEFQHCEKYFGELTENSIGDDTVRVRMRKGKESSKFLALFERGVVIQEGGRNEENVNKQIYCIYSPFGKEPKAIELNTFDNLYLNSGNVYYLITPDNTKLYKWIGNGSNDKEKEFAPKILLEGKEVIETNEGEETEEFWQTFFDQDTKPEGLCVYQKKSTDIRSIEPRLFLVSNEGGSFQVEEIYNFGQEDLDHEDIMILDAYDTLFIWMGNESNAFEQKKGMELCSFYIEMCVNNGRENELNIEEITEGNESAFFKSFFPDWDDTNFQKSGDKLKELSMEVLKNLEEAKAETYYTFPESDFEGYEHPRDHKYTKEQINEKPPQIRRNRCELYLEDDEFNSIFGMTKEEFYKEKNWKRLRMKKEKDLF